VSRALEASAHAAGSAAAAAAGAGGGGGGGLASSPPPPPADFAAKALSRRFARRLITPLAVVRVLLGHATPLFPPASFRDAPAAGGAGEPPGTLGAGRRGGGLWGRYAGRDLGRLARVVDGVLRVELPSEEADAAAGARRAARAAADAEAAGAAAAGGDAAQSSEGHGI
jgi:hypothetical protein